MRPKDFLREVWGRQAIDGHESVWGFVSVRSGPTSWFDLAVKLPRMKFAMPDRDEGDIYFSPNLFSQPRRRKEHVLPSRWLYADLDTVDPVTLPDDLCPTMAWESSPKRYQCMWLLPAAIDVDTHSRVNRALTYKIDADRAGWDLTQVLRLPGTLNHKYDDCPPVQLLWEGSLGYDGLDVEGLSVDGDGYHRRLEPFDVPNLTARQVLRLREGLVSLGVRAKLQARTATGDRSRVLFRLEMTLLGKGIPPGEVFVLLKDTVWNKFDDRGLRADIARANARVQS